MKPETRSFYELAVQRAVEEVAGTLDQATMMREVAELALPLLGQWCAVYMVDARHAVTAVSAAATDATFATILRQVVAQLPVVAIDARLPWNRAMQTGEPVMLHEPGADFYDALGTPELRDFVTALAPRSLVCVPLMARGRTIGRRTMTEAKSSPSADGDLVRRSVLVPDRAAGKA